MLSCHKMDMVKSEGYFFFCPQSVFLQRHSSKNMLDSIRISHLSYGTMSYFIYCIWHLLYAVIPYCPHAANGTILNATSEYDLFPNILIEHILDTPTEYKWNPVQSGLLYFANNTSWKWWNRMLHETTLRLRTGTVPVDSGRSFVKACYCITKASVHEQGMFLNHYSTENSKQIFNKSLKDTSAT